MREPAPESPVFALVLEYDRPDALVEAVRRARRSGLRRIDAYTPFPIDGLSEALDLRDNRVAWLTLAGGIVGAAAGLGVQIYANLDFPIVIDGRALLALPGFAFITFELTVLFAVAFSVVGMFALNRLPRLHHPLFDLERFQFASLDRFFLVILSNDALFGRARSDEFIEALRPIRVDLVGRGEGES